MKKFAVSFHGYDKKQVNDFLDEFTENYSNILETLKIRDKEIKDTKEKLAHYENMEATLNKAIFLAEDASTQIKKLAREESESILENSKRNANRIVNNALLKAEKIDEEAEDLKRRVENYKRKVKALISEQFDLIDEIETIEF